MTTNRARALIARGRVTSRSSNRGALCQQSGFRQRALKREPELRQACRVSPAHYHEDVVPRSQRWRRGSAGFAKEPLDPVACDGVADGFANAKADPAHCHVVLENPDGERALAGPGSSTENREKSFGQSKAFNQTGMSCQRPLSRRRLRTLRPLRELMRCRNPWTRWRLRFDIGRRCFFMTAQL